MVYAIFYSEIYNQHWLIKSLDLSSNEGNNTLAKSLHVISDSKILSLTICQHSLKKECHVCCSFHIIDLILSRNLLKSKDLSFFLWKRFGKRLVFVWCCTPVLEKYYSTEQVKGKNGGFGTSLVQCSYTLH